MATAQVATKRRFDPETLDPHKVGLALFLAGEVIFFGCLILAYAYYRLQWDDTGGPTAAVLDIPLAAFFTALLLASSGTVWLAERSLRAGNPGGMRLWLAVTVALGAAFLIGQGFEWASLIDEGITVRNGLFGTTFFTLTGFHGFHVLLGLVALAVLLGLALRGWLRGPHSSALETVSIYWHFVDVVWIVVFSVIYVWELVA
jgi:heme/copper-type cytochrome/quinol oxidase subunit 3